MTTKELQNCYTIAWRITELEERRARLLSCLSGSSPQSDGVPTYTGPNVDKIPNLLAKLDNLNMQLTTQIIALEERYQAAQNWLLSLPVDWQSVIYLRYFKGLEWDDVARGTSYSKAHIYYINREVLAQLS